MSNDLIDNKSYLQWFADLKKQIQKSQIRASLSVNSELIKLYWFLGSAIDEKEAQYGDKLINNLTRDLKVEFPDVKGFSRRNLYNIRRWYRYYNEHLTIMQQAVAQLSFADDLINVQQAVAQKGQQAVDQIDL